MASDARRATDPVRFKVPGTMERTLLLFVSRPMIPFEPRIRAWIDDHAGEPCREAIHLWLGANPLDIAVLEKSRVPLPTAARWMLKTSNPDALERVDAATDCLSLRTRWSSSDVRAGLWTFMAAGRALSSAFNGAVYDPILYGFWPLRLGTRDVPGDGSVAVGEHIRVLSSMDARGLEFKTCGLTLFGVPDLAIRNAPPDLAGLPAFLLCGVAQILVEAVLAGAHLDRNSPGEMRIGPEILVTSRHTARAYRTAEKGGASGGGLVRLERTGRGEKRLEPSGNSIELQPPAEYERDAGAWMKRILAAIEPREGSVLWHQESDQTLGSAQRRALSELGAVKSRFLEGLLARSKLLVKKGFKYRRRIEYMWVEVATWKGNRIGGNLSSSPAYCADLRSGDPVEVPESDVYDWIIRHEDGTEEGGYTDRFLQGFLEERPPEA